ncbi:MAG: hypothetical protein HY909_14185 [Deltaproteobacteria bacterium]|nr:hypothetical protein [Deltaproteobacteria bacterium]
MLKRLFLGIFKGLFVGGALGALLHFGLQHTLLGRGDLLNYAFYGVVGASAGALAGRPPWKAGAWVASILKGVFGILVGCGLYALAAAFLTFDVTLPNLGTHGPLAQLPLVFAPLLAMVYASLVELDDGGENAEPEVASGVRVDAAELPEAEEEEAPKARQSAGKKKA